MPKVQGPVVLPRQGPESRLQLLGQPLQMGIHPRLGQGFNGGQRRSHPDGIPIEGPRGGDPAGHDLPPAHHGAKGVAAGDGLGKGGQIRGDPIVGLGPAQCQSETGDHLVKDQQDPILPGHLPHSLQIARFGQDGAGITHTGLHEHRRDLPSSGGQGALQRRQVVPGQDDQVLCGGQPLSLGMEDLAGGLPVPQLLHAGGVNADLLLIGPAMVLPFKLHNLILSCVGPGQPEGIHHHLGSRVLIGHQLRRGNDLHQPLRQPFQVLRGGGEMAPPPQLLRYRPVHRRRAIAQQHGPKAQHVVNVFVAVHIV